jgi:hypothetical protein
MRSSWMVIWLPCHSCVACYAFGCITRFFNTCATCFHNKIYVVGIFLFCLKGKLGQAEVWSET